MPEMPPKPVVQPKTASPTRAGGKTSGAPKPPPPRDIPWGPIGLAVALFALGLGWHVRGKMTGVDAALTAWAAQPVPTGQDAFDVAKTVRGIIHGAGGVVGQDGLAVTISGDDANTLVAVSARYRVSILGIKTVLDTQVNTAGESLVVTRYTGDGVIPLPPDPAVQARLDQVLAAEKCPAGTTQKGFGPPQGHETWCEKPAAPGKQHGPYRGWHPNGTLAEEGQYQNGKREGKWTRHHPNGTKAAEAFYSGDVQHGRLRRWDANGVLQEDVEYRNGLPTR